MGVLTGVASFEFCLRGPAVSARAKDRALLKGWTDRVSSAARAAWPQGVQPLQGDLAVSISEFSEGVGAKDRDNLAKPILDAMQGIIYANDRQVRDLRVDRRDLGGRFIVRYMSPVVAASLIAGEEFLWIRISPYVPNEDLVR